MVRIRLSFQGRVTLYSGCKTLTSKSLCPTYYKHEWNGWVCVCCGSSVCAKTTVRAGSFSAEDNQKDRDSITNEKRQTNTYTHTVHIHTHCVRNHAWQKGCWLPWQRKSCKQTTHQISLASNRHLCIPSQHNQTAGIIQNTD